MTKQNYTTAPVVTILGHVDHGKTSLLDYIRRANIAAGEAGGITQHISAYQIVHNDYPLTFIDTPGHAAFHAMRRRGGSLADIVILIIAADDGVMPQTKESLKVIKELKLPFIVAINKADLPGADIIKIKTQLTEEGIYVEGFGGNTPVVEISAKTGKNIDSLLETLVLLSQLEDLKDTRGAPPQAAVLEANIDPHKGPIATLLVKQGTFKKNDNLYAGPKNIGKIRAALDFQATPIAKALPSTPFQVLGLDIVPQVGQILTTTATAKIDQIAPSAAIKSESEQQQLNIIIKADVIGTLDAILGSLPQRIKPISFGTGAINESDLAAASLHQAEIISFNIKTTAFIARLAETEKVKITSFNIIYELLEYLQDKVSKKEQKEEQEQPTATLQVLKIFNIKNVKILGCKVTSGTINKQDRLQNAKIVSLKQADSDINQAQEGQELGITTSPPLDVAEGDVLQSFKKIL